MGCQLHWRPVGRGDSVGGSQLKDALRQEYNGLDDIRLDRDALPFLRGLAAAKVDGAKDLIAAIEQHETIETYLEC